MINIKTGFPTLEIDIKKPPPKKARVARGKSDGKYST
jgi:hypothetical protein